MKLRHLAAIMLPGLMALACSRPAPQDNLTQYVDLKLGSGGHGHVFVGANVPNGMVQLGPTSIPQSWDWCSGYHESDSTVIGFSHTHLSGTGIGDLFDITVMPVTGEVKYARMPNRLFAVKLTFRQSWNSEREAPGERLTVPSNSPLIVFILGLAVMESISRSVLLTCQLWLL